MHTAVGFTSTDHDGSGVASAMHAGTSSPKPAQSSGSEGGDVEMSGAGARSTWSLARSSRSEQQEGTAATAEEEEEGDRMTWSLESTARPQPASAWLMCC